MAVSDEEVARRRKVMTEAGRRAHERIREALRQRQERLASAIHASIAEAGESVSVGEAIAMLDSFFETGEVSATAGAKSQKRRIDY
jgi:glutamate-1-semialdehyde aminotransferase